MRDFLCQLETSIRAEANKKNEFISPRIFENKTLYALEEDIIKLGCRADEGIAMVKTIELMQPLRVFLVLSSTGMFCVLMVLRLICSAI